MHVMDVHAIYHGPAITARLAEEQHKVTAKTAPPLIPILAFVIAKPVLDGPVSNAIHAKCHAAMEEPPIPTLVTSASALLNGVARTALLA